jgi:hypothetical protein
VGNRGQLISRYENDSSSIGHGVGFRHVSD